MTNDPEDPQKIAINLVTIHLDLLIAVKELQADTEALKQTLFRLDPRAESYFGSFLKLELEKSAEYLKLVRATRKASDPTIPETQATPDKVN